MQRTPVNEITLGVDLFPRAVATISCSPREGVQENKSACDRSLTHLTSTPTSYNLLRGCSGSRARRPSQSITVVRLSLEEKKEAADCDHRCHHVH